MRILATILISCLPLSSAQADEFAECQHQPIAVKSRPVIERLPVKVIDPADVAITQFDATIVAERQAGIVFLLSNNGEASVLGQGFHGLERIANSASTGVYALCCQNTASTIYRITDSGFRSEFVELNFRAAGLAAGSAGQVWTSNSQAGQVILIDAEGSSQVAATLDEQIVDVIADDQGAYVLTESGKIWSVGSDKSRQQIGYVSSSSIRLQRRPNHQIVALANSGGRNGQLLEPQPEPGNGRQVGKVPSGTQAFAFDRLGNLTLGNPDLRALTRVTSHFEVPCPHCGKPVSMQLSPEAEAKPTKQRSF